MALIQSARHRPDDVEMWRTYARADAAHAHLRRLERLEERAIVALRAFAAEGPFYVGVSWGKDSTALVHLVCRAVPAAPALFFPAGPVENPDCVLVRDAFLRRFDLRYSEHPCTDLVWSMEDGVAVHDGAQAAFARASKAHGMRYASGIRADESRARRMRVKHWGEVTKNTCAPLGHWTFLDVYAYAAKYDLPLHPAYACSWGGRYPREAIRVSTIGGINGGGQGRREWEERYYPETVRAVRLMASSATR